MGVVFAEGEVLTASGDGVALAEVAFYDLNGELLAIYPTNVHGEFDAGPPDKGLPSEASFRAKLFAAGLVMRLSPDPIDPSKHLETSGGTPRLRLTASSLLWSPKPLVLVVANASKPGSVHMVERSPTAAVFTVNEPLDLIIRYPRGASVEVAVNGSIAPPDVTRSLEWREVDLVDERFLGLEPGTRVAVKLLEYPGEPEPRLRTHNYLENAAGGELDFRNLELAIATFAVSWIIMPASYYIILLSIAYSLAYVIAGSREKVPITLPAP
ncbi:TPA: hypothetical protein EYP38_02920 [Candidatus Micrarchaeota archaeon]|nr:hypothetical protein [Candidatus Micrarchaeota archaeon]